MNRIKGFNTLTQKETRLNWESSKLYLLKASQMPKAMRAKTTSTTMMRTIVHFRFFHWNLFLVFLAAFLKSSAFICKLEMFVSRLLKLTSRCKAFSMFSCIMLVISFTCSWFSLILSSVALVDSALLAEDIFSSFFQAGVFSIFLYVPFTQRDLKKKVYLFLLKGLSRA